MNTAAGGMWAGGKALSYLPQTSAYGTKLLQGGEALTKATLPYTKHIVGGPLRSVVTKGPLALAGISAVDGAFQLNEMLKDPAAGHARMLASNYANATPGAYLRNAAINSVANAMMLGNGDGTPLAEMGEAFVGLNRETVDGEYEARRTSELDSALKSRQADSEQATNQAMQTGGATQQQLRDAATYTQRQREADMQARNWRPWLWGMSQ